MYAKTFILIILKCKDEVLVKMSHFFHYIWDKFSHILSHNFKSIKAMIIKLCTTVKAIEIHILTINKVHKKLRQEKEKSSFYFKSNESSVTKCLGLDMARIESLFAVVG